MSRHNYGLISACIRGYQHPTICAVCRYIEDYDDVIEGMQLGFMCGVSGPMLWFVLVALANTGRIVAYHWGGLDSEEDIAFCSHRVWAEWMLEQPSVHHTRITTEIDFTQMPASPASSTVLTPCWD